MFQRHAAHRHDRCRRCGRVRKREGIKAPASLRPLSIAEILDRAIDIGARNWLSLGAIFLVFAVPAQIVAYAQNPNYPDLLATLGESIGGRPHAAAHTVAPSHTWLHVWTWALIFAQQIPSGAIILATGSLYAGRRLTFLDAYAGAIKRAKGLFAVTFALILALIAIMVVFAIPVFGIPAISLAAFGNNGNQIVLAVTLLVAAGPLLVAVGFAFAVFAMALRTLLLENVGPSAALERSWTRLLTKGIRRRALIMAAAMASAMVAEVAVDVTTRHILFFGTIHSHVATVALFCFIGGFFGIFPSAAVTIFYYDVRVRIEAYDLALLARAHENVRDVAPEAIA